MNKSKTFFFGAMYLLMMLLLGLTHSEVSAQCTSITGVSTTVTHATCPSNGQIVVNSSASGVAGTTYKITSGPVGYPSNTFTSNTIPSLLPGTYQIQINCGSAIETANATINNDYTAPVISANVSSCTGYASGGVIEISATGSSGPLRYAVVQSDDPTVTIPDASFITLSGSISHAVANYGQYQIKVKDGCNVITTKSVEVKKTSPRAQLELHGEWTYDCSNIILGYNLLEYPAGNLINKVGSNYRLELWPGTTTTCPTIPATLSSNTRIVNTDDLITLPINTRTIAYRLTSPCGEVTTGCKNLPAFTFTASARVNRYCSGNIGSIAITHNGSPNYTLSYTGYDASNSVVASGSFPAQNYSVFHFAGLGLPATITRFTYTFTDGCGRSTPLTSVNVPVAGSATVEGQEFGRWCTSVLGTGVVRLFLNGYIPGMGNATPDRIELRPNPGPGAAYIPHEVNIENWMLTFYNVPPGSYNLYIKGNSAGDCSTTIPVTISGTGLTFTLDGTTSQLCNGLGSIAAVATTNSGSPITYTLKNSAGTAISTNSNGNFVNLSAGTYTVDARIAPTCDVPPFVQSKTFTIAAGGANPQVVKKIGVICEPSGTKGTANLELAGVSPFQVQMKLKSEPESAFVTQTTSAGNIYTKTDLNANTTYEFRIIDPCGKSTVTELTILSLDAIAKLTTTSPCLNQPYTLAVEQLPGATYSWTKNGNPYGTNLPQISFVSFAATDNGTYVCTVSFSGCVSRTVTYEVNSSYCGGPLDVVFGPISATLKNGELVLNWSTLKERHNSRFEIEASTDGKNFKKIGTVHTKATDGNSDVTIGYSFNIKASEAAALGLAAFALLLLPAIRRRRRNTLLIMIAGTVLFLAACNKNKDQLAGGDGNVFIRIAQIDEDGTKSYSKIFKVINED